MDFDEKVSERYEKCSAAFTSLDELTADMLRTYCLVCVQIDDLNETIAKEGYMVETEKGLKENPYVNTVHKLNADKARYFAPLKRALSKQADEAVEDDMDAFLGL